MKYEKSCGAIIVNKDNKILILQQVAGHWGFPKGHVENDETEVETATREIKEETNLEVEINEKYRYVMHYSPEEDIEKDVVFFIAKYIGGDIKIQEEEVLQAGWFTYEEALEKLTHENSKEILKNAWRDYQSN